MTVMMFEGKYTVASPFCFNLLKHHMLSIRQFLSIAKSRDFSYDRIKKELVIVGTSQMDIYSGILYPAEIVQEIKEILGVSIASEKNYIDWLFEENKEYRQLNLSDGSTWTCRLCTEPDMFVHIHPSRYSKNSFRCKAHSLRSAICLSIWAVLNKIDEPSVQDLNFVRTKYLQLSPVNESKSDHTSLRLCSDVLELFY